MEYTYSHLRPSKPAARRAKNAPVFCVGRYVFVNWPQPRGAAPSPVPMIDGGGKPIANDLVDGEEVEIVSWRPGAREGVTYQIRRRSDGCEWWIPVEYLRHLREVPPVESV